MQNGWIKLHRQIFDCWVWNDKPFSKGQAWVDLLLLANHQKEKFPFKNEVIAAERGVVCRSVLWLADRWGWSREKTRRFLSQLQSDGMVLVNATTHMTTITLVNYGIYQDLQPTKPTTGRQQDDNQTDNKPTHTRIIKNEKNDRNTYTAEFQSFWSIYPRKSEKAKAYKAYCCRLRDGFSEDELLTAAEKYAAECKKDNREQKYIKLGATFLSASTPFTDYLKDFSEEGGVAVENNNQSRGQAADFYEQFMGTGNSD